MNISEEELDTIIQGWNTQSRIVQRKINELHDQIKTLRELREKDAECIAGLNKQLLNQQKTINRKDDEIKWWMETVSWARGLMTKKQETKLNCKIEESIEAKYGKEE